MNQIDLDSPFVNELNRVLKIAESVVYLTNLYNGWYDRDRNFGDDIALLHSEVSEMFEAYRDYELSDATANYDGYHTYYEYEQTSEGQPNGFFCRQCGNVKENIYHGLPKPEGVGSEAADIFIRLLDTCYRNNINLGNEFIRKINYNRTRSYRHGGKKV